MIAARLQIFATKPYSEMNPSARGVEPCSTLDQFMQLLAAQGSSLLIEHLDHSIQGGGQLLKSCLQDCGGVLHGRPNSDWPEREIRRD